MRHTIPVVVAVAVLGALPSATAQDRAQTRAQDQDPARPANARSAAAFDDPKANPYFPLTPGLVTILRGIDDGEHLRERVSVTHRTKLIQGVRVTVVRDVVRRRNGSLAEKTFDWYAADNDGNVWYFGENTATYDEHGRLESREGSWQAGVDGAVAGMIMPADPRPTLAYRQEFWRGHAEDQAWIVGRNASVRTGLRRFHHAVRTFEWSRLEPRIVSEKFYARGVGIIREFDVAGGHERFQLVAVRRP